MNTFSGAPAFTSLALDDPAGVVQRPPPPLPPGVYLHPADSLPGDGPPQADLRHAFAALYNATFGLDPASPEALSAESVAHWREHPFLKPAGIILARRGEQLVGAAVASVSLPSPSDVGHEGTIELVVVHPTQQGQGLGRRLLHELLAWLAGQAVRRIVVSTDNPALVRVLTRYGFRPEDD